HAPHHTTKEWVDKIHEMHLFDEGWNKLREKIFENQKRLGVIPQDTQIEPWPTKVIKNWDDCTPEEKKLFIKQVEIFAAYEAYNDNEIGRVIQAVEDMGKLDNTLIIYINGDNGTSAEVGPLGTPIEGTSFAYTFDAKNAKETSRHKTQYFEMMGQWALYNEGWLLSTQVNRAPWEAFGAANPDPLNNQVLDLYDLNKDFSQSQNLAANNQDKVKQMKQMFIAEAKKYQVFPMDAS